MRRTSIDVWAVASPARPGQRKLVSPVRGHRRGPNGGRWRGGLCHFHDELTPSERALRATAALESIGFGPVDWLLEAGSTNADLLAEAQAGAPHGRILVTDYQSAGKGRRDRTWTTAPGDALLASVLLRPTNLAVDELSTLTSAVAIATTEACQAAGFRGIEIKWPNDLVVSGPSGYRKLAGILAQSTIYQGKAAVVIGLGLNVVGDRLGELRDQAVALSDLGAAPDRTDLLISIIEQLARWLEVVESPGRAATLDPLPRALGHSRARGPR